MTKQMIIQLAYNQALADLCKASERAEKNQSELSQRIEREAWRILKEVEDVRDGKVNVFD